MRKIAYTAVFGGYDTPRTPTVKSKGWEYICFSDRDIKVDGWETVIVPGGKTPRENILIARYHKIVFHDHIDCDICLWTDANIKIQCDLNVFMRKHKTEFFTMEHPRRSSIYAESKACQHRTEQLLIRQQMEQYVSEHYLADNGLISSGILLRRNNDNVRDFCEEWFAELDKYSIRDQLSFNYILWKHELDLETLPYQELMSNDFHIRPHKAWK